MTNRPNRCINKECEYNDPNYICGCELYTCNTIKECKDVKEQSNEKSNS